MTIEKSKVKPNAESVSLSVSSNKIIIVTGPTATGKTLLGIELSKLLGGEVVSADSMQVYKYMDIGTAKPTPGEMSIVPHHMIDIVSPQENYSVARYVKDAAACIDDIQTRGKLPIVVGGSGLYIDSLVRGREFAVQGDLKLREELEKQYDTVGGAAMLARLRKFDEKAAATLHENDRKRIVRAFEVFETTGLSLSAHDAAEKILPPRYDVLKIALTYSHRDMLYDKINNRVDEMIKRGLVDEVKSLLKRGIPNTCTAMQAIGYKEITNALSSNADISLAVDIIKQESRRYAKRQLTWLRRDKQAIWFTWDTAPDFDRVLKKMKDMYNEEK